MIGKQKHEVIVDGVPLNGAQVAALLVAIMVGRDTYMTGDIRERLDEIDKIILESVNE